MTVAEIFSAEGEPSFRARETDALSSLASRPRSVVACGGGVVLSEFNRATLQSMGTVAYLKVTAAETVVRLGGDESRPLLTANDADAAERLLANREGLYLETADLTVETVGCTPGQVADQIVSLLAERSAR